MLQSIGGMKYIAFFDYNLTFRRHNKINIIQDLRISQVSERFVHPIFQKSKTTLHKTIVSKRITSISFDRPAQLGKKTFVAKKEFASKLKQKITAHRIHSNEVIF